MGWVVDLRKRHDRPAELTARPTGSSQRPWSGAAEPAEVGTMLLLGIVSSRLRAVGSPHAEVLCAYYLPSLQRETTHAVWPLTDAGRELLAPYGQDLSPWQAVTEALVAQVTKPSDVRRALIERADRQARSALDAAFEAWAAVTGGAVDALARVAS